MNVWMLKIASGSILAGVLAIAGTVGVPAAHETGPAQVGLVGQAQAGSDEVPPKPDAPILLYFPIVHLQAPIKPRVAWHLGGVSTAVAVQDHYAYLGQGAMLVVLDVADAARPHPVASVDLDGEVHQVLVADDHAYVMTDRVHVIDVADPNHPREVAGFGRYGYLAVANKLLYVAEGGYAAYGDNPPSLVIVDVAHPTQPREVARLPHPYTCSMSSMYIYDLVVNDGVAYMLSSNGIYRVDVRNATDPQPIVCDFDHRGRFAPAGRPGFGLVYQARTLTIVDTHQRDALTDVAEVEVCAGQADRIAMAVGASHYAYAVCEAPTETTVHVYDLAQPAQPRKVGALVLPLGGERTLSYLDMAVQGKRLYLTNAGTNLAILDISRASAPRLVGAYDNMKSVRAVAASAGLAYVLDDDTFPGHLHVLRVSRAQAPEELGTVRLPGEGFALASAGNRVYVIGARMAHADWWTNAGGFLSVVDVSQPDHPTEIGRRDFPDLPADIALLGDFAYMVSGWRGGSQTIGSSVLRVVDLSDPARPVTVFEDNRRSHLQSVATAGKHVFLANPGNESDSGLLVLDVSTPNQPRDVGHLSIPDVYQMDVYEHWLYVLGVSGTFSVVDIRDPAHPVALSRLNLPYVRSDYNPAVAAWDDHVFLHWGRLRVFDVSQPSRPMAIDALGESVAGSALAVDADLLYVAEDLRGLTMVDWRGDASR